MANAPKQKTEEKPPAAPAEAGADDIIFTSPHARLIIYDGKKIIARFLDGVFSTSDAKIAEFLRSHELVQERQP